MNLANITALIIATPLALTACGKVSKKDISTSHPTSNVATGSISNVLGDYGNFNAPRTFGIEASMRF